MGVTGLHDSHTRVLAVRITLLSRVYLLRTVLSYMIFRNGGSSLKISLSNGCFSIKCHLLMTMSSLVNDDLFQIGH